MSPRVLQCRDARPDRRGGGAVDVRQDHLAPLLWGPGQEPARPAEARVGEHGVDPAERAQQRARDHLLLLIPLRDIAADRDRAVLSAELARERLQALQRAGGEHQAPAGPRRLARRRCTDSRRGPVISRTFPAESVGRAFMGSLP